MCSVQGWIFWQQLQVPVAHKTAGYIISRAGSAVLQQQASQHSLTQGGLFIHQLGLVDHSRVLVRASCGHRQCYRVVSVGCVRQAFGHHRDPLLCPAHQPQYANYSQYVTLYFNVLAFIGYQGVVVWDWHDVPAHPHMHWDATVFLAGVVKQNPNHSLLRLSFHDRHAWVLKTQLYLQGRLQNMLGGVWATAWYWPFAGQGHGMVAII